MKRTAWALGAVAILVGLGLAYVSAVGAASESLPKDPIKISKGYGTVLFPSPKGAEDQVPPVAFSHSSHKGFGIKNCLKCHNDEVFAKKQELAVNEITMAAIYAGKFCGACHDGKTESPREEGEKIFAADKDNESSCKRCHNVLLRKA
ncbi:MAG: cytochrome c3 family protein [Planctomycetes bacterium]|nr:cytochrome c3 family protein [Planctomycetota bacterium]